MIFRAFTDGASRGNPGESGIGVIVRDENNKVVLSRSAYIGLSTNNMAEYTALITLLREARALECSRLVAHSDSELMVRQVNGKYKVKDSELKKLHGTVRQLVASLPCPFELKHIPREMNGDADRLANEGIDAQRAVSRV
jgi:ribonuclease HI